MLLMQGWIHQAYSELLDQNLELQWLVFVAQLKYFFKLHNYNKTIAINVSNRSDEVWQR